MFNSAWHCHLSSSLADWEIFIYSLMDHQYIIFCSKSIRIYQIFLLSLQFEVKEQEQFEALPASGLWHFAAHCTCGCKSQDSGQETSHLERTSFSKCRITQRMKRQMKKGCHRPLWLLLQMLSFGIHHHSLPPSSSWPNVFDVCGATGFSYPRWCFQIIPSFQYQSPR